MRELDVLLGRWLEHSWGQAAPELRESFTALLEREDDQIWDWLMGRVEPDPEFTALIDDIRGQSERIRS
jgi:succinate dehydrogenase flavin-adding protein (antitoxin of CptAB toxin-antitoxin module)